MSRATLSVFIITKNEAHNIKACIESCHFADEIIVLDSGSTDETVMIAEQMGAVVQVTPDWPGFGIQLNRAFALTTSDYVLSLDADERLSAPLQAAIIKLLEQPQAAVAGYAIPFHSFFLGHRIRFGDWRNEWHTRLFKRNALRISEAPIHASLTAEGVVKKLPFPILHYSYDSLSEVLQKMDLYSTHGAERRFQEKKTGGLTIALVRAIWCFIRGYGLRFGFLDGKAGFVLAVSNSTGTFYRYLKLAALKAGPKSVTSH